VAPSIDRIAKYWRFFLVALIVLLIDQSSKLLVMQYVPAGTYVYPPPISIIPGFMYIVHIYNTGAAWGIFAGRSIWLALLAVIALFSIYFLRRKIELERPIIQYIVGLLVGGIIGNFIDRMLYGHVVDFIDIHLPGYRWPAFNVADIGISIGVGLYILFSILDAFRHKA